MRSIPGRAHSSSDGNDNTEVFEMFRNTKWMCTIDFRFLDIPSDRIGSPAEGSAVAVESHKLEQKMPENMASKMSINLGKLDPSSAIRDPTFCYHIQD